MAFFCQLFGRACLVDYQVDRPNLIAKVLNLEALRILIDVLVHKPSDASYDCLLIRQDADLAGLLH